jgi:hypothetical protein
MINDTTKIEDDRADETNTNKTECKVLSTCSLVPSTNFSLMKRIARQDFPDPAPPTSTSEILRGSSFPFQLPPPTSDRWLWLDLEGLTLTLPMYQSRSDPF